MSVRRISPAEAHALVGQEGWAYLDVRSVPEFEAGHPAGAYNIPLLQAQGFGMAPNPNFLDECRRAFPAETKLVVGCKSGGRSLQAALLLVSAGYAAVLDQHCGFDGAPGSPEPGWSAAGLPVAQEALPERSYAALAGRQP